VAVGIFVAGFLASLLMGAIVMVILRDTIGKQPDVLGFEGIRGLSRTQKRIIAIVFLIVWAVDSWLSFRLARRVWRTSAKT
jgi:hypothetical protein